MTYLHPRSILLKIQMVAFGLSRSKLLSIITARHQSKFRKTYKFHDEKNIESLEAHYKDFVENSTGDARDFLQSLPSATQGKDCNFQDFVDVFTFRKHSYVLEFAKNIDETFGSFEVKNSYTNKEIEQIKCHLQSADWLTNEIYWRLESNSTAINFKDKYIAAKTSDEFREVYALLAINVFFSFMAAFDIDTYNVYAQNRKQISFIAVLYEHKNEEFLEKNNIKYKYAGKHIKSPHRRLFEFLHAIYYQAKNKQWPDQPCSRKELAAISNHTEARIDKWFNGGKKLTVMEYFAICSDLDKSICRDKMEIEVLPQLYIFSTFNQLFHESNNPVIGQHSETFFGYMRFWEYHKSKIASPDTLLDVKGWPIWFD